MKKRFAGVISLAFSFGFFGTMALAQSSPAFATGKPTIAQVPSPLSLEVRPTYDFPLGNSAQIGRAHV